jgi:hypothetical protein
MIPQTMRAAFFARANDELPGGHLFEGFHSKPDSRCARCGVSVEEIRASSTPECSKNPTGVLMWSRQQRADVPRYTSKDVEGELRGFLQRARRALETWGRNPWDRDGFRRSYGVYPEEVEGIEP